MFAPLSEREIHARETNPINRGVSTPRQNGDQFVAADCSDAFGNGNRRRGSISARW
jgi:hypothetical protein